MCKIVTFTNLSKIKELNKLIDLVSNELFSYEKDGFGYAIEGKDGVFGERICNSTSFDYGFDKELLSVKWVKNNRNKFGTKSKIIGSGIFHGRTSTNDVNLLNTHPLVKRGMYLIHNGVVNNHGPKYEKITTNDTEHLLHHLTSEGIKAIEKYITGYYAVSAIDSATNELTIFRDNIAPLHCAYIKAIDSYIFATTETLIKTIAKEMKWKTTHIAKMNDNTLLKFKLGQLIEEKDIKPLGYSQKEASHSSKSLGYNIGNDGIYGAWEDYETYGEKDYASKWTTTSKKDTPSNSPEFTEDECLFLEEVTTAADHTYIFKDYRGNDMSINDFFLLEDEEKLYCTVIRPDGTICCPNDYHTDKLYSRAI